MPNITYLLGAGASCKCLPVVFDMQSHVLNTAMWMGKEIEIAKEADFTHPINQFDFSDLYTDLEWLAYLCDPKRNFSIDTYAKKLKVAKDLRGYKRLKNVLTLYFTLQQKKNLPDVRYDNFWGSLLDKNDNFPTNVRILSWNYDFQPELTYQDFINSNSLSDTANHLKMLSHSSSKDDFHNPDEFKLFKLNGSATYFGEFGDKTSNYLVDNFKKKDLPDFFYETGDWYMSINKSVSRYKNQLTYAWDHESNTPFYDFLRQSIKSTNILVVIGYSFPFFNKEVDKMILGADFMPNLSRVYFQIPEKDSESVMERFKAIRNLNIDKIPVYGVDQFTFPYEM